MSDEKDKAPPPKSEKKPRAPRGDKAPREKTCYNCGEVSRTNSRTRSESLMFHAVLKLCSFYISLVILLGIVRVNV